MWSTNSKKKELELKERETVLREKEIALKEKDSNNKTNQKQNQNSVPITVSSSVYNFAGHSEFQTFWKDFKQAIEKNDKETILKMTRFPFTDFNELAYGRSGLTCNSSTVFLNKLSIIFPNCASDLISTSKPEKIDFEILTSNEHNAGVKFCLFFTGNCGKSEPIILGYVFGKEKGFYKLVGLKYME